MRTVKQCSKQTCAEKMKDNRLLNLIAAFLTSTATPTTTPRNEIVFHENITLVLAENVRRQLIKDNYDYLLDQTTLSSLPTNPYHTGDVPEEEKKLDEIEIVSREENTENKAHTHYRRSKYVTKSDKTNQTTIGIEEFHENKDESITGATELAYSSTGKVKYSMLKIKGPSRRSAKQPRLLKEEKENEVSIVNLGNGPVPQFRLPQSHRQYRAIETDSDRSYSSEAANVSVSDSAVDLER